MESEVRVIPPAAHGVFRLLAGLLLLAAVLLGIPLAGPAPVQAGTTFRRPVDIGFIRYFPSHGGALCTHGATGNGCRFDCESNGSDALEDSQGIFYQCPTGTLVHAAAEGLVLDLHGDCGQEDPSCQGGWGNWVLLEHPFGLRTLYAHLLEATVTVGTMVECGAVLGLSGATGTSSAEGLYFEVQDLRYTRVDPFAGQCNPALETPVWEEQTVEPEDSGRTCSEAFQPNEAWIGAACSEDEDCQYENGICLEGWPGGACSGSCADTCPEHPGAGYSGTVCRHTTEGDICVAGCSSLLFPGTGCRDSYVCQWLETTTGAWEPGCVPETHEQPDGGVPDADIDTGDGDPPDTGDLAGDATGDGPPDITAAGDSSSCACRSPAHGRTSFNYLFILGFSLLISGLRRRFFRCPAKVNMV
jgi:hypothetical protein